MNRTEELRGQAQAFHEKHPDVWDLFVRFTFEKINRGFKHFGANAVMERVRWETETSSGPPDYKVNNNHTAFYARRFGRIYPEHSDFFRTRVQKNDAHKPLSRERVVRELQRGVDSLFD